MAPSDDVPVSPSSAAPAPVQGSVGVADEHSAVPIPGGRLDFPDASAGSEVLVPHDPPLDSSASLGRTGVMLVFPVAALAFLLASFPARNSDLWMHLASGRRLVQGESVVGGGAGLVIGREMNRTWLFDLLSYGLYSALGGIGLVIVKALLIVWIALLLLGLSRVGRGLWLPAVCTALALLAMSSRLFVQPATVSYLLLALTFWFLWGRGDIGAQRPFPVLPPWQLFVLFVIWVNMDSWFVLGLATVGLVWLGQSLDEILGAGARQKDWPGSLLRRVVCLGLLAAGCMLNPSNVAVFTSWTFGAADTFTAAPGSGPITSPFEAAYFAYLGPSPAALAYFPLLALSLLSFVVNWRGWSWQRFLPWLGLAVLSAFYVRTIPFFAIVAGPVLARNIQEFVARAAEAPQWPTPTWQRGIAAGYALAMVVVLVLPLCAWPGWLQSRPFEPRRWAVETLPSVEKGAATTRRWLQEGKLGSDARGLHLSPVTAHAFAWHCPEEQGLRDDFLGAVIRGDAETPADFEARMRALKINHVILYDTDRGRIWATMERLLQDPQQWPLLYVEGQLSVFGWRDPAASGADDPFKGRQLDMNHLAFHPAEDKKAPRTPSDREPEPREWWDAFWKTIPPRPVDQDEATMHLFRAESMRPTAPLRHLQAWEASQLAGLVGAASGWTGPAGFSDARLRLTFLRPQAPSASARFDTLPVMDQQVHAIQQRFALQRDDASPADLYLAVRAARRAVALNPDDAQAYLVLGESYMRLLDSTRERAWSQHLPELVQLRRAQASAALNQAVLLKPDFARAHMSLSKYYASLGFVDLTLEHMRAYDKLMQEAGTASGAGAEPDASYGEELSQLTKEVDKRLNMFEVASADWKVRDRAIKAYQMGLAGKAADLLLESNIAAFGAKGMALELELLLKTGRAKQVSKNVLPEHETMLGAQPYHLLRAMALAAIGDYGLAREESNQLCGSLASGQRGQEAVKFREIMAILISRRVLDEQRAVDEQHGRGSLPALIRATKDRQDFRFQLESLAQSLRREADMTVLRGLLALEEGDVDEAEIAFRDALSCWKDSAAVTSGGGLDFKARGIAQDCLEWLK